MFSLIDEMAKNKKKKKKKKKKIENYAFTIRYLSVITTMIRNSFGMVYSNLTDNGGGGGKYVNTNLTWLFDSHV